MIKQPLKQGDYVLATKYSDGDTHDHWCIGFYDHMDELGSSIRYYVVDSKGNQFRMNGFRRIKKISEKRGKWILKNKELIELSGKSLWYFSKCKMK